MGEWSAARPGRTLPPGKTRYPLYRRLGGTLGRSGRAEHLVHTEIWSRTLQRVISRYTNWSYLAQVEFYCIWTYIYLQYQELYSSTKIKNCTVLLRHTAPCEFSGGVKICESFTMHKMNIRKLTAIGNLVYISNIKIFWMEYFRSFNNINQMTNKYRKFLAHIR